MTEPSVVQAAALIVNAAGGWAGEVAALAELDVPVAHSRRTIYASAPRASAPGMAGRRLPMTIDVATGVYLRGEGERILIGGPGSPRSAGYSTEVDWPWLEELLLKGVRRFPWLSELPLDRTASWAGTYEITPDNQGILGPHPDAPTWVNACGFSGHGFMQCPEIGRLAAVEATGGEIADIDVASLRIERFAQGAHGPAAGMVL